MYSFVVVVILEVEIKRTGQVGSEGRKDCLFEDVIQNRYRLRWNSLSVGGEEQSPHVLLGRRSLFPPNQWFGASIIGNKA